MLKIPKMASAGMMLLAVGACAQRADEQNKATGTIVTNDVAAVRSGAGADGRLTLDEFRVVAGSMITALDTDANGALSAAELAALPEGRRRGWTMYDGDGDGTLTAAELQTAMAPKFTMRDRNHDGAITPDEIPDGTPAGGFLF
jgi:hypothetical protein